MSERISAYNPLLDLGVGGFKVIIQYTYVYSKQDFQR